MKNKIIIISGDPNSINSEVIYKAWKKINNSIKKKIYLISNYNLIKQQLRKLNYNVRLEKVKDINDKTNSTNLKIIDVFLNFNNPFKISKIQRSQFVIKSLNLGHNLGLNNEVKGIINCAINKNLLNKKRIGVTEYLAAKCKIKDNSETMLLRNNKISISPITTHIDIKQIHKNINSKLIIKKVRTIDKWFKKENKKKPKIAILGLNPHNAELRNDSEEKKIIIPAVNKLKKQSINVHGPIPADTIFLNEFKKYDVIVGMFHDQVLGPFKALFKYKACNVTLGLKYLRVSPDHGTATNLIGKNKANIESFLECINYVNKPR